MGAWGRRVRKAPVDFFLGGSESSTLFVASESGEFNEAPVLLLVSSIEAIVVAISAAFFAVGVADIFICFGSVL
jgi:hypothetical protein